MRRFVNHFSTRIPLHAMAPRRDPLHTDMKAGHLAPENPGKRLPKPRKDLTADSTTASKASTRQHQPLNSPVASSTSFPKPTKKRAREPEKDELPPKRAKKAARIADTYRLDVSNRTPPTLEALAYSVIYAPESAVRPPVLSPIPPQVERMTPPSPTASDHFDADGNWLEPPIELNAEGKDPSLAPPTARSYEGYLLVHPNPKDTCQFKRDPKRTNPPVFHRTKPICKVTAGIPLEEYTPEDLVQKVAKKRTRLSAAARKKGMTVKYTDRPTIRKTSTSTNPPSTSASPTTSKPSLSTTGRTSRRTAR